jgi:hypothetical protein
MLAITLACAAAVLAAVAWRVLGDRPRVRGAALGGCLAVSAGLGGWLVQGPLAAGWAGRAGTPARLLASPAPAPARPAQPATTSPLLQPFSAGLRGRLKQGPSASGSAVVDLRMRLTGGVPGVLRVRLAGDSAPGGGVAMRRSAVTLGPPSAPGRLQGRIVSLQGSSLEALVGSSDGRAMRLRVDLSLGQRSVGGTVVGRPVTG